MMMMMMMMSWRKMGRVRRDPFSVVIVVGGKRWKRLGGSWESGKEEEAFFFSPSIKKRRLFTSSSTLFRILSHCSSPSPAFPLSHNRFLPPLPPQRNTKMGFFSSPAPAAAAPATLALPVTMLTAAALGVLLINLSFNIIKDRRSTKTSIGDGGIKSLASKIRAHANLTE